MFGGWSCAYLSNVSWSFFMFDLASKVVSTHRTGTHPYLNLYEQAIMGFLCALRVCCKFLDLPETFLSWPVRAMDQHFPDTKCFAHMRSQGETGSYQPIIDKLFPKCTWITVNETTITSPFVLTKNSPPSFSNAYVGFVKKVFCFYILLFVEGDFLLSTMVNHH